MEDYFYNKHKENVQLNIVNQLIQSAVNCWFILRISYISLLVMLPTILILLLSDFDSNTFGLVALYALPLSDDLMSSIQCYAGLETKMISFERISALEKIPEERGYEKNEDFLLENKISADKLVQNNAKLSGDIEFKNLSVHYRNDLPTILDNVNFKINKGEKIGVIGRTGSGKSTLLLLLERVLSPFNGNINLSVENEISESGEHKKMNINQISLRNLRKEISILPQEAWIFTGTIRENLDPTNSHSDDELKTILQHVKLEKTMNARGGLTAEISDGGKNLSSGEKQLLCLGRALLKKRKIFLVDEATANIDLKTEKQLRKILQKEMGDSTVLMIAHRIETLKDMEKILAVSEGKVFKFDNFKT